MKKSKLQSLKIVIGTSLVWFLLDVFLIMYFVDCKGDNCTASAAKNSVPDQPNADPFYKVPKKGGVLDRFLPGSNKDMNAPENIPADPNGPGEYGRPVVIPPEKQALAKEMFKINQFNLMASDMISFNRTLPDVRLESCKRKEYDVDKLPSTSVIIVFHNEAWSTLLRSVHSIINRSPRHLIHEILLVDDASERSFLGHKLDEYVAKLTVPTRVLRMGKRQGLIRARLRGASEAKGEVLTYLDAHIECTQGWLEPLLYEIYKDRTTAICPIIDSLSDEDFSHMTATDTIWGGFDWKLVFGWYTVPERENQRRNNDRSIPMRTPTMAGGLFSINRDYFYEVGSYDSGMDIWGGENLEMSFRIWMCGGQILIATCSHVGHVFRKTSPYSWPGGVNKIINHNSMRTVAVWMDEYQDFYKKINPDVATVDYGDVSERVKLRKEKNCKSFKWYLQNIYPESQLPIDFYSLGEVRNKATNLCLDTMGRKAGEKAGMVPCHNMGGNQVFALTGKDQLQADEICVEYSGWKPSIQFTACRIATKEQQWKYDVHTQTLQHVGSGMCLGPPGPAEPQAPTLVRCSNNNPALRWLLEDYKNIL